MSNEMTETETNNPIEGSNDKAMQSLQRVQAIVRRFIPDDALDLTGELLQSRKADGSFS
jgi:hypothetical protein